MGIESATYLNDLVATNPIAGDKVYQGDDHIRLLKTVLRATFPGLAGRAWRIQAKGAGYTVAATDNLSILQCSASLTLSLTTVATIGNGFLFVIQALTGADVVLDPAGSELINGSSSVTIPQGSCAAVFCDGSAWYVLNLFGSASLLVVSSFGETIAAGTTKYISLVGIAADTSWGFRVPTRGYISHLRANAGSAPGAGQSYTYTLYDSATPTAITATNSGIGTSGAEDDAHVYLATAGSVLSLQVAVSADAAVVPHWATMLFRELP